MYIKPLAAKNHDIPKIELHRSPRLEAVLCLPDRRASRTQRDVRHLQFGGSGVGFQAFEAVRFSV